MAARLDEPCRYLKGVGPRKAEALEKLGIRSVEDLLLHAPRQYYDRSHLHRIRELQPDQEACVRVQVESLHARPGWGGRPGRVVATVADESGRLRIVWYTSWVRDILQPGQRLVLAGRVVSSRGRLEMRQPEFERADDEGQELLHAARIVPFYPLVRGVSQKWLRTLMRHTLDSHLHEVHEILPPAVLQDLPERRAALAALHFPASAEEAEQARRRFKFEELFLVEAVLGRRRQRARAGERGPLLQRQRSQHQRYLEGLPFALTAAQQRVLDEILADLTAGRCMQRLLQGDVGSGKTVVAVAALLCATGNGFQGALMAPTEALALQHAERLLQPAATLGVRLDVLVGSRSETEKERLRARIQSGDLDLVVGTHALIQDEVRWARLGLAVVDEQHRFGVMQRLRLQQGGAAGRPHVLVLSATPIPRSLALTLFGDLDVSVLDEKPPGRRPVETRLVPLQRRADMLRFVRTQVEEGRQAYMVYPLIETSDKIDLRAATEEFEGLRSGPLAGVPMGLLHGRLRPAEKEALLQAFRRGSLRLLVSTTVIEVGIDVAAADIMIIHHPERFGLSQLHQLRGRVGRAGGAAWCFLLAERSSSEESLERLRAFAQTQDGFAIAELDLRLRGPGDFLGTRQHGLPALRFADLSQDLELLENARSAAFAVLEQDPELVQEEHRGVREHLATHYQMQETLAAIG
ncbi:MAG TPA: ATP-dependent DNA helicase RecG [Candidatus Krumholzibacteria bacterium]|jgi:ATP-dependent DNA helicase RecG|nr:ATP-dependent DNA helicase RecG [Candidatus Krumholzibacteria bacterium]